MIHKRSKEKLAILEFLKRTNLHPTADVIYSEMRKENPGISLSTIYRNLRFLKEEGEIKELGLAGGLSRFDGETRPHYHFRCDRCGRVFNLEEPFNDNFNRRIADKTGFQVTDHVLEFRGLCIECKP